MRWNLRMAAAERGIWKSTEMRRRLAEAGLEVSAGKMSRWWTTTPVSMRLEDLDVICAVLDCTPMELLICEPDKVAAARPANAQARTGSDAGPGARGARGVGGSGGSGGSGGAGSGAAPRLGRNRSAPPA